MRAAVCYTGGAMTDPLIVRYKKLHPDAVAPEYKTPGAAAFDFGLVEDVAIPPRSFVKVRTGLVIQAPQHHVLLIVSRSSNPGKKGIDLANSVGVIDSDYRGPNDEIFLVLENITDSEVRFTAGERVAQGMIVPVPRVQLEAIAGEITEADRGGFGSTGA